MPTAQQPKKKKRGNQNKRHFFSQSRKSPSQIYPSSQGKSLFKKHGS